MIVDITKTGLNKTQNLNKTNDARNKSLKKKKITK